MKDKLRKLLRRLKKQKHNPDIIVCRHGESLANQLGDAAFIGDNPNKHKRLLEIEDYDVPLTKLGMKQARKLGKFLRKIFGVPDVVYDSGYLRARQTREIALKAGYTAKEISKMVIKTDDRLRERECGNLRKAPRKVRQALPYFDQHQKDWNNNLYQTKPVGGESIADQTLRAHSIKEEVRNLYPGKTIFFFCHGHTEHSLQIAIEGLSPKESHQMLKNGWVDNCTIHFYKGKKGRWKKHKEINPLKS